MNNIREHQLVAAHGALRQEVISLLKENELPTSDIDESKILFALTKGSYVIGTGGLEFFDDCALLRSLSVRPGWQGRGLGKIITRQLEQVCREKGVADVYLLTETAQGFFNKEGYLAINRADAPLAIKKCSQFITVCASSGILMHKNV